MQGGFINYLFKALNIIEIKYNNGIIIHEFKLICKTCFGGNKLNTFLITPSVNQTQEFIEIANDFSNPLEIVREAISNAFDATAKNIHISFSVVNEYGNKILLIRIKDDGSGMDKAGLQSFFDLGNSLRRNNPDTIGEKGHGTKVYFNSSYIEVNTVKDGTLLTAKVNQPYNCLFDRQIPVVNVTEYQSTNTKNGTEIIIKGYNNNRREKFTHAILKDYILWSTKFGSVERVFGIDTFEDIKLFLKGLDKNDFEPISFGHIFPEESRDIKELFAKYMVKAPDMYCKRIVVRDGYLKDYPEIRYDAVFSIEGNKIKQDSNPMLKRRGRTSEEGSYTVQERYGLWLCKDYIPIQKKNEWITKKGSEYTKFHAFFNCQDLNLTANRGSVDNTPTQYLDNMKKEVEKIYNDIVSSGDWADIEYLETETDAYITVEKEKTDYSKRLSKINKSNISIYKNCTLVQPQAESGVYALVVQLSMIEPNLFPFKILDYDTHSGIDVIVKGNDSTPITKSKLYYVEFKYFLANNFNHSFENLYSIVCWDTDVKNNEVVEDISKEQRKMIIVSPQSKGDYTRYYLENLRSVHRVQVFVLKDYLKDKLNIDFRPRTQKDTE